MHQSKKGKNWFYGMKSHIGVDVKSDLAHTLITTANNVSDVTQTHNLLHSDEKIVFGDAEYQDAEKRPENAGKAITWNVAMKRSVRKALKKNLLGRAKKSWRRPRSASAPRSSIRFVC